LYYTIFQKLHPKVKIKKSVYALYYVFVASSQSHDSTGKVSFRSQQLYSCLLKFVLRVYRIKLIPCKFPNFQDSVARCTALSTHTTTWNTCCHNTAKLI